MKKAVTFAIFTLLFGIPYLGNSAGTSKPAGTTGQAVTSAPAVPSASPSSQPVISAPTAAAAPASGQAKTGASTTLSVTAAPLTITLSPLTITSPPPTITSTPVSASVPLSGMTAVSAPAASSGDPLRRFHRQLQHGGVWPGLLETEDHSNRSNPRRGSPARAGEGLDSLGERLELRGSSSQGKPMERTGERSDKIGERSQQHKGGSFELADQPQGSQGRQTQTGKRLLVNRQPNAALDSGSNLAKPRAHRGAQLEHSGEGLQDNKGQELQRLNAWFEPRDLRNK